MARPNVYVPDDLFARAKRADLNVSKVTQDALRVAVAAWEAEQGKKTDQWLRSLKLDGSGTATTEDVRHALAETRRGMSGELDG